MAEELKIARATLAEHLSRIESIIMDDLLGSFTNFRISPDEFELFKDMAVEDSKNLGFGDDEQFKKLLKTCMKTWNMKEFKKMTIMKTNNCQLYISRDYSGQHEQPRQTTE